MTSPGALHLVPNTLDFGTPGAPAALDELLPRGVIRTAAGLEHWICENAKTTRAFLKRVEAIVPLCRPLQELAIVELPRPIKGREPAPVPTGIDVLLYPTGVKNVVTIRGSLPAGDVFSQATNPAVATVENAWQIASNQSMPAVP